MYIRKELLINALKAYLILDFGIEKCFCFFFSGLLYVIFAFYFLFLFSALLLVCVYALFTTRKGDFTRTIFPWIWSIFLLNFLTG